MGRPWTFRQMGDNLSQKIWEVSLSALPCGQLKPKLPNSQATLRSRERDILAKSLCVQMTHSFPPVCPPTSPGRGSRVRLGPLGPGH